METSKLAEALWVQIAVVKRAPIPFLGAVIAVALSLWWGLDTIYSSRLASTASLLTLKDAQVQDYREKLAGASPDQARARIEALEKRVAEIAPPNYSPVQISTFKAALANRPVAIATITFDSTFVSGEERAKQLGGALRSAGWKTESGVSFGVDYDSPSGLTLLISSGKEISPAVQSLTASLQAAGISFDAVSGSLNEKEVSLIVSRPY